jgi:(1->4)-alpha-D-glucan 1-alpha-D-glucosylmutase
MNATSTHDTKRSEDVRARLNVISEIPEQWETQVMAWSELNRGYKTENNGKMIPDANDEYFLYQTLVGSFPFWEYEYTEFVERIKNYAVKAVREAKVYTAWLRPDTDYEDGFIAFIEKILQPGEENQFLQQFYPFQEYIAHYGIFNSLSQTLLKMTAPGIPDFYQGTELWDLSLVDPDNRRPVDFEQRRSYLQELKQQAKTDILSLIADLLTNRQDGRIKMFLIAQTLAARNNNLDLFQQGSYIPLNVTGSCQNHIIAFARYNRQHTAIAIVPCFLTKLLEPPAFPLGEDIWQDTRVEIPQGLGGGNWQDVLTNQEIPANNAIAIGKALQYFPVALLISENKNK